MAYTAYFDYPSMSRSSSGRRSFAPEIPTSTYSPIEAKLSFRFADYSVPRAHQPLAVVKVVFSKRLFPGPVGDKWIGNIAQVGRKNQAEVGPGALEEMKTQLYLHARGNNEDVPQNWQPIRLIFSNPRPLLVFPQHAPEKTDFEVYRSGR
jgi:hypothetical protein